MAKNEQVVPAENGRKPLWIRLLIAQIAVALCCVLAWYVCEHVVQPTYSSSVARVTHQMNKSWAGMYSKDAGFLDENGKPDLIGFFEAKRTDQSFYEQIETELREEKQIEVTIDYVLRGSITYTADPSDETGTTVFIDVAYADDEVNMAIAEAAGHALSQIYIRPGPPPFKDTVSEPEIIREPVRTGPNTLAWVIAAFVLAEILACLIALEKGDWKTKMSYIFMGFGNISRGQVLRGILFFLFEVVFVGYMVVSGGYWISMLPSLGKVGRDIVVKYVEGIGEQNIPVYHDNSFKILLYGVLTLFFIAAFIYTMYQNIKQNHIAEKILATGKKLKSGKDDLRSLVDDQFHKTLLALPLTGIIIFTVLPILFMILVAFTNYDGTNNGLINLFHWQGLDNFKTMLSWSSGSGAGAQSYAATFGEILVWTLIWAFFATFTNYFLGMFVAMAINKKGIKFKKGWRTILVLTIAIPQFISLLYVSKMFAKNGIINGVLLDLGWIKPDGLIDFFGDSTKPWLARITVILINIWIGIPYLMLITTGILMNIPADLYESARIDGANPWQQYIKITLPYMLFVTGPYLLTSFTGNMNNFNVIYLLTGGGPNNAAASSAAGSVGYTDLLITWLFKITQGANSQYYLASVVGILVFVVVAVITLVVYRLLPSIKNEEDFQ